MTLSYDRRRFLRATGGTLALGSLSGCVGDLQSQTTEPISFGAVLPLSGPLGQIGTHGLRATQQAVEDINRAGGLLGRPVELIEVDSGASADVALEGYETLVDEGAIGFVGGLVSDVSLALAPKAAEDGIMEVSPSSTTPQLSTAGVADGRKYFGRTVPSDILQAIAMTKILDSPQYVNAETVSLLYIDNSFGADLAAELTANLDAEVVADVAYDPTADSFAGPLDDVLGPEPDAVGFVSVPGQETGILDAYGSSQHVVPWVFAAGMFGTENPSYYEGFYSASLSSTRTDGYFNLQRQLSDIAPLAVYAVNAYDAMFLMGAAVEKSGTATGTAIAETIRSVSGGTGHTVSVGEFDAVKPLIEAGRNLNYEGASGGVDLTEQLEPLSPYVIERITTGAVEQLELLQTQFFASGGSQ
ncbi:ABC transporter substrate-binding protein [Haloferax namakaokahaiae]|uniref:ABC transporter substrate-binding protein n=1 Tax=Haloferax namakaokahaiae TaxID=1748331 RepID=A0ABD5ZI58_9EURY